MFRAPDDGREGEGIVGMVWGANDGKYCVSRLPDLGNAGAVNEDMVKAYAKQTFISPRWVRTRMKRKRLLARSMMGVRVLKPDKKPWGVLVLGSQDETIKEKAEDELQNLCKRSLRHIVAEL